MRMEIVLGKGSNSANGKLQSTFAFLGSVRMWSDNSIAEQSKKQQLTGFHYGENSFSSLTVRAV